MGFVAKNFTILAGTRFALVGIDDQIMGPFGSFLGHERPFHAGRKTRAAAPAPLDPGHWQETVEALAARGEIPEETRLYRASFAAYAAMDIAWNLTNLALSWATHPGYRRHQTWHPLAEYGGFLWKMSRARRDRAHAARAWAVRTAGNSRIM